MASQPHPRSLSIPKLRASRFGARGGTLTSAFSQREREEPALPDRLPSPQSMSHEALGYLSSQTSRAL